MLTLTGVEWPKSGRGRGPDSGPGRGQRLRQEHCHPTYPAFLRSTWWRHLHRQSANQRAQRALAATPDRNCQSGASAIRNNDCGEYPVWPGRCRSGRY